MYAYVYCNVAQPVRLSSVCCRALTLTVLGKSSMQRPMPIPKQGTLTAAVFHGSSAYADICLAFSSVVFHCRVAISLVQAYKDLISPVLPSVCRFLPSCSTYSVEAFEQFGASKGVVLMAWRILRCNPFRGGYQGQYDPPQWPPVGLEAIFRR